MEVDLVAAARVITAYEKYVQNRVKSRKEFLITFNNLRAESRRRKQLIAQYIKKLRRKQFQKTCWVQPELMPPSFWDETVPGYTDVRFLKKFRLSKKTFNYVCEKLNPYLKKEDTLMRNAIPVAKKVAIAISLLKSNCDLWTIADLFRVGKSTAGNILHEFCDALIDHFFKEVVVFPSTEEDRKEKAEGFMHKSQFPGCFGAMDGSHLPILAPHDCPDDYYNYKSFHSIQLLAVVDSDYKFMYANVGRPGRMNDASVFKGSGLYKSFVSSDGRPPQHTTQYCIISDAAFPLLTWLMKPFPISNSMSIEHRNFNYRLSSARMAIEDSFGRLKGRWRILLKRCDFSLVHIKSITKACLILHNLCETNSDYFCPEWLEEVRAIESQYPNVCRRPYNDSRLCPATTKRNAIADHLMQDGYSITYV